MSLWLPDVSSGLYFSNLEMETTNSIIKGSEKNKWPVSYLFVLLLLFLTRSRISFHSPGCSHFEIFLLGPTNKLLLGKDSPGMLLFILWPGACFRFYFFHLKGIMYKMFMIATSSASKDTAWLLNLKSVHLRFYVYAVSFSA